MRKARTFTPEFKREVVEELLSSTTRPPQLCLRCKISSGILYHWKKQYIFGKLNNEPTNEGVLLDKINKLRQMLAKFTLENEFLKKPCTILSEGTGETGIHHCPQTPHPQYPERM